MWNFLKFIIPALFVISFILLKTIPENNKIYSGIKNLFKFSTLLFRIFISICIFIFIADIVVSIMFESVKGFFKSFKGMP